MFDAFVISLKSACLICHDFGVVVHFWIPPPETHFHRLGPPAVRSILNVTPIAATSFIQMAMGTMACHVSPSLALAKAKGMRKTFTKQATGASQDDTVLLQSHILNLLHPKMHRIFWIFQISGFSIFRSLSIWQFLVCFFPRWVRFGLF